jgi:hypothetical protein
MMAITTSSSTNVKPRALLEEEIISNLDLSNREKKEKRKIGSIVKMDREESDELASKSKRSQKLSQTPRGRT